MSSWSALHFVTSGFLSILNILFKIEPQAFNIGAGDSNTKSVKLQVPLFIVGDN